VTEAWLFDIYPLERGMSIWFIDQEGRKLQLIAPFQPCFYIHGPRDRLNHVLRFFNLKPYPLQVRKTEKRDLWSGEGLPVLEVRVGNPLLFSRVVRDIARVAEDVQLYNADIPLPQMFFFETGLFPLAYCELEYSPQDRQLLAIHSLTSPWDVHYDLPPLSTIWLRLEGEPFNPKYGGTGRLVIVHEGREYILEEGSPIQLLSTLNSLLETIDPDLILSRWGDSFILPRLSQLANRYRFPLGLNRDPQARLPARPARSYFSYGRLVYRSGWQLMAGRWHLDLENSFIIDQTGLEGLFELSRLTKIPLQQLARTSTGTGITSMQLDKAYQQQILIPWRKREPESFKSALELLVTDKGGLVYLPRPGFYQEVAEIDFSSMYPTLMTKFNISPETVGCPCCPEIRVPEIGYPLCQRRRGLIPETLEPLLIKRAHYKRLSGETDDPGEREVYDKRQRALKWLLVVCFGYLGYRNARFGRIEAHEATTAYGREMLLKAKEIAEARGFRLLHALVDSLWLQKEGASPGDYEELVRLISQQTGMPVALEGIYRWLIFPPSHTHPELAVPHRFFGVFTHGGIKVRGLELRRSDTPPLVREAQQKMLEILALAPDEEGYQQRIPAVLEVLADYLIRIGQGQVELRDLVITRQVSRRPQDYEKDSLEALAVQELLSEGIRPLPGEKIHYIITDASSPTREEKVRAYPGKGAGQGYDGRKYAELVLKATRSLLSLFGYDLERLGRAVAPLAGTI